MHSLSTTPLQVRRWRTPQSYEPIYLQMREFTQTRTPTTPDELWFLEHTPVFTQGPRSEPEHLLDIGDIPLIATNRGGQVTYHGPGQLVVYVLVDITRLGWNVRQLVHSLQNSLIALLHTYGITGYTDIDKPGVYVGSEGSKIASLGLRIHKGGSYHGLSLNVDLDLEPFSRIAPCGVANQKVTKITDFKALTVDEVYQHYVQTLPMLLGYPPTSITIIEEESVA